MRGRLELWTFFSLDSAKKILRPTRRPPDFPGLSPGKRPPILRPWLREKPAWWGRSLRHPSLWSGPCLAIVLHPIMVISWQLDRIPVTPQSLPGTAGLEELAIPLECKKTGAERCLSFAPAPGAHSASLRSPPLGLWGGLAAVGVDLVPLDPLAEFCSAPGRGFTTLRRSWTSRPDEQGGPASNTVRSFIGKCLSLSSPHHLLQRLRPMMTGRTALDPDRKTWEKSTPYTVVTLPPKPTNQIPR